MKKRKSMFAQYAIMDFASNALDHFHSRVHLITLLAAACAGRNMARQSKVHIFLRPVEAHKTDQILVPVHRVPRTRNLSLPSRNPKMARRRRARRGHKMILDREDAHMIPHMARPQMTLPRDAKQNPKSVAPLTGDLCRQRSQVHRRCQIRVNVPNHQRNRRPRQKICGFSRRYDRPNSLTFLHRTECASVELWNL